jgi:hypothetical protein
MISRAEAVELCRVHAREPTVLSLCLGVPLDPAELVPGSSAQQVVRRQIGGVADRNEPADAERRTGEQGERGKPEPVGL